MNPNRFEILITPIKKPNPDLSITENHNVKEDQLQIRRKSCECSECGKNNRTMQRLYLMEPLPSQLKK